LTPFSCPETSPNARDTEESTSCALSTKTQPDSRGWRVIIWVIEQIGLVDTVLAHSNSMGWLQHIVDFAVAPPWWTLPAALVLGFGLIVWDYRRRLPPATASSPATIERVPSPGAAVAPRNAPPVIEITSPVSGGDVAQRYVVRGTVYPPLHPVHVLIYSGNRQWWLQGRPRLDGASWSVECQFGNEASADGNTFRIVAIDASNPVASQIPDLPVGVAQSSIITVSLRRQLPQRPTIS